jgi:hypothetical protein
MSKTMKLLGQASLAAAAIVGVTGNANAHEAGWSASVEAAVVKPHASEDNLPTPNGFGYDAGWRAVIGYEDADGLGGRFRYYNYDQSAAGESLSRSVYDLEATQDFDFANGSITVAAGVRYIDATEDTVSYKAWGLTADIEGSRNLGIEGLALTASARWSATFGNTEFSGGGSDHNDLHNSLEVRVGPEYTFAMNGAHTVTVGAGVEAEYLNNEPISFTDTQDAGFVGFYLNASTRF